MRSAKSVAHARKKVIADVNERIEAFYSLTNEEDRKKKFVDMLKEIDHNDDEKKVKKKRK